MSRDVEEPVLRSDVVWPVATWENILVRWITVWCSPKLYSTTRDFSCSHRLHEHWPAPYSWQAYPTFCG